MLIFAVLASIMLFLHGLAAFSDEMARLGGERLRQLLRRLTRTDCGSRICRTGGLSHTLHCFPESRFSHHVADPGPGSPIYLFPLPSGLDIRWKRQLEARLKSRALSGLRG